LDTGDDEDQVGVPAAWFVVGAAALDVEAPRPGLGAGDAGDGGAGVHIDAVGAEFGADEGAEFRVDGGQHLGQRFDLSDVDTARVSPSAISRPT
jgi:glycerate kinase